jgi:alpha-glucosidase
VLSGKIGDYIVVALQQRGGDDWYLGASTDVQPRTMEVPRTFLQKGRSYVAEVYADGPGADWATNPLPVAISRRTVTSASRLRVALARGGGQAIRFRAVR